MRQHNSDVMIRKRACIFLFVVHFYQNLVALNDFKASKKIIAIKLILTMNYYSALTLINKHTQ